MSDCQDIQVLGQLLYVARGERDELQRQLAEATGEVTRLKAQLAETEALRHQAVEVAVQRGEAAAMRRALEYGVKELSKYFESCGRPGQTPKLHRILERLRVALQKGGEG